MKTREARNRKSPARPGRRRIRFDIVDRCCFHMIASDPSGRFHCISDGDRVMVAVTFKSASVNRLRLLGELGASIVGQGEGMGENPHDRS
jgi:hypothetical protein